MTKIKKNKKGDMPWWLKSFIIGIAILVVLGYIIYKASKGINLSILSLFGK